MTRPALCARRSVRVRVKSTSVLGILLRNQGVPRFFQVFQGPGRPAHRRGDQACVVPLHSKECVSLQPLRRSAKALGDLRTAVVTKLAEASAAAAAHAQALDERVERNRKAAEEAVAQVGGRMGGVHRGGWRR